MSVERFSAPLIHADSCLCSIVQTMPELNIGDVVTIAFPKEQIKDKQLIAEFPVARRRSVQTARNKIVETIVEHVKAGAGRAAFAGDAVRQFGK